MTYLPDMHSYLHHSSLLIQAYPTTRITTKYSLPRKPSAHSTSKRSQKSAAAAAAATTTTTTTKPDTPTPTDASAAPAREKREPAATLTLKTYHADTGICLKYRTDKAQEVGRLLNGLGRLARGEVIEMPSVVGQGQVVAEDRMEVDAVGDGVGVVKHGKVVGKGSAEMTRDQSQGQSQSQSQQGGGKKKKKGKK